MMTNGEARHLQALIDRTVAAANRYHRAQRALNEHCAKRYGFEPGDRDLDNILDGVFGGDGMSAGMTAEDFDREMREASE